jgi:hypothetical protein
MMAELDTWRTLSTTVEEAREARDRTEQTERLAALFLQALPQALNYNVGLGEESSESWQGSVGRLTPEEPLAPMCAETEGAPPSSDTLTFSLRAGDLGELKFSINRGENGVRVLIGVDGRNALTAAGAERAALEAALRATGLTVQSVAVVPLAKFGTPLARRGEAADARNVRQVHGGLRGASRGNRRVKLIG